MLLPKTLPCPHFCQVVPCPDPKRGGRQQPLGQLCCWAEGAGWGKWDAGECPTWKGRSPHGTQCGPSPSLSSPSVTLIYYIQDLPIKLFSNLLPFPPLLCGHINLRFSPCRALAASQGSYRGHQGTSHPLGGWKHAECPRGGWLLGPGENLAHGIGVNPPGQEMLSWTREESWEGSSYLFKAELLMLRPQKYLLRQGWVCSAVSLEGFLGPALGGVSSPNWDYKKRRKSDSLLRSLLPAQAGWDFSEHWLSPSKAAAQHRARPSIRGRG